MPDPHQIAMWTSVLDMFVQILFFSILPYALLSTLKDHIGTLFKLIWFFFCFSNLLSH